MTWLSAAKHFLFAKAEVTLPGSKYAEIIRLSQGKLQLLYGLGGIAMMDGLGHGACAIMPGLALVEVYARIFQLWDGGELDNAKALSISSSRISSLRCSILN